MQDERSQHQNRRRAFQVLTSRLMDLKITREVEERRSTRRNLVRGADRSEKIRTYNYAQVSPVLLPCKQQTIHHLWLGPSNGPSYWIDNEESHFSLRRRWNPTFHRRNLQAP